MAESVWRLIGVELWTDCTSGLQWLDKVRQPKYNEAWGLILCVVWQMWCGRNKLIWDGKSVSAESMVHQAKNMLSEWSKANTIQRRDKVMVGMSRWNKPTLGLIKCNTDASYDLVEKTARVAGVLRDSEGNWKGGISLSIGRMMNPLMAEAVGLKEVLSWVKERGDGYNIMLEIDSMILANALNSERQDLSYFGLVVSECKALMCELKISTCCWVWRSANQCAHVLAQQTGSLPGRTEWGDVPPSAITHEAVAHAQATGHVNFQEYKLEEYRE